MTGVPSRDHLSFATDEGDKPDTSEGFAVVVVFAGAFDAKEVLGSCLIADGDDEASADGQLLKEGWRNLATTRGDDDGIEGGAFGPAEGAVSAEDVYVPVAEIGGAPPGQFGEKGKAFDGVDLACDSAEDGGGVAGACPDFEDAILFFKS